MRRTFSKTFTCHAKKSKVQVLSKLQLDINASHHNDQIISEPAEAIEKSPEAIRGESLRGDVQLPLALQAVVEQAIEDGNDKAGLRLKALDLYAHLRATATISTTPINYRDRHTLLTAYDPPTSLAYLAGMMPSIFGATVHVLNSTKNRLNLIGDWEPERVIDFGSGTGSAVWAIQQVWGSIDEKGKVREYFGLDSSRAMIELSSTIISNLPKDSPCLNPNGIIPKIIARTFQLPIPASASSLAKLKLSPNSSHPNKGKRTIAMASFTLGDLGTKEKRRDVVRGLWDSDAEVIIIIDRGTPAGSRMVLEAREQLLNLGKKSLEREVSDEKSQAEKGCFVLAPCPHDGVCPLFNSSRAYCHFSQRVQSPAFLRHTKHTTRGEDDAKFSYVVIQRGIRPITSPIPVEPIITTEKNELDLELTSTFTIEKPIEKPLRAELDWPRVISPPMKRSGHIILEVCTSSGELERHTIPKSQGKQPYYDSRKTKWGDTFPHEPKNGPVMAPQGKEVVIVSNKIISKKAERIGKEKVVREGRARRGRSKDSEDGDGGVKEYEIEIIDGVMQIRN